MEKSCKFDAFKIGKKDFLMITLVFSTEVKDITYEILGDKGTHIEKKIKGCLTENYITEQIVNIDETLVFKYKIDDTDVGFNFINYNELMEDGKEEIDTTSNVYSIDKNIHMNIEYEIDSCEIDTESSGKMENMDDVEYDDDDELDELALIGYDEADSEDEMDDLYKPVSDEEDNGIATLFHNDSSLDMSEFEEIENLDECDDSSSGWRFVKPEPIKVVGDKIKTVPNPVCAIPDIKNTGETKEANI